MEHHQRSAIGNTTIMSYLCDWFLLPSSFEQTLWLSQILQGMAIKYAVEHWRRAMPRGMGTLYWQLNDCWPVASWSSVDSLGRWKALHYMARQFYAPLLISGLEDPNAGTVEVHVTSDLRESVRATATWRLTNVHGDTISTGSQDVVVVPGGNTLVSTLDFSAELRRSGPRDLLLWLALEEGGRIASTNLVTFARPKHLPLEQPALRAGVSDMGNGTLRVTLTAEKPALWAWISLGNAEARYSDNFVHIAPGRPVQIMVTPFAPLTPEALESQLELHSLYDTFEA